MVNSLLLTFYPSVWRWNVNNYYTLVHANIVNYVTQISSGLRIACNKYNLSDDEQFSVHTNNIIGLYTTNNSLILTSTNSDDKPVYSVAGNHSIIDPTGSGVTQQHFHVAIVAVISELCAYIPSICHTIVSINTSLIFHTSPTCTVCIISIINYKYYRRYCFFFYCSGHYHC